MEAQTLCFNMDGEWYTNFMRTRYWYEDLSYIDAFEQVKAVLHPEEDCNIDNEIQGLLTGTRKLAGNLVDGLYMTDDNRHDEYAKAEREKQLRMQKKLIELDMNLHPERYIDFYSTCKGMVEFEDFPTGDAYRNFDGSIKWYEYFVNNEEMDCPLLERHNWDEAKYLWGGTYPLLWKLPCSLLDKPLSGSEEDKKKYDKALYDYWHEQLKFEQSSMSMEMLKAVRMRQRKYEMDQSRGKAKERKEAALDKFVERHTRLSKEKKVIYGQERDIREVWESPHYDDDWAISNEEILSECGLISPTGEFYACGFAEHNSLANHLVTRDKKMLEGCVRKHMKNYEDAKEAVYECMYYDWALPYLYELGWVTVHDMRSCQLGLPVRYEKYNSEDDMPQAQLNTLYDWRIKYDRRFA